MNELHEMLNRADHLVTRIDWRLTRQAPGYPEGIGPRALVRPVRPIRPEALATVEAWAAAADAEREAPDRT